MGETARDTVVATIADSAENRAPGDEARAERSPDVAHDINAETTCKTTDATTSEAADETASGATKEIASERAGDAPCEYKVFVRDYAEGEDRLFADDFCGFLEKF